MECSECSRSNPIYRCPRCSVRTCSLVCVSGHKKRTKCDGRKVRVQDVKLSEYTSETLFKDFKFLEDAQRFVESSMRLILSSKRPHSEVGTSSIRDLQKRCGMANINLKIAPSEMAIRVENDTHVSKKSKKIQWKVAWCLYPNESQMADDRASEETILKDILRRFLTRSSKHEPRIAEFANEGEDSLHILIKDLESHSKPQRYIQLDLQKKLRDNLQGKTIIEHPVFYLIKMRDLPEVLLT